MMQASRLLLLQNWLSLFLFCWKKIISLVTVILGVVLKPSIFNLFLGSNHKDLLKDTYLPAPFPNRNFFSFYHSHTQCIHLIHICIHFVTILAYFLFKMTLSAFALFSFLYQIRLLKWVGQSKNKSYSHFCWQTKRNDRLNHL